MKKTHCHTIWIAAIFHVTNNFVALENPGIFGWIIATMVLVVAYILAWRFYHKASKEKMVV
jgi:hypothetical protein